MVEKYEYRLLTFCDPVQVCSAMNKYDALGYDVVALIPTAEGKEYTLFLKKREAE